MSKKNKKSPAQKETAFVTENLKYQFSPEEIQKLGKDLASQQLDLVQLDADRKQSADEFKAKISFKEAEIGSTSRKVNNGYEYRDLECEVTFDEPVGKKTCRRTDTQEVIWIRDLSEIERQRQLDLSEKEESVEA